MKEMREENPTHFTRLTIIACDCPLASDVNDAFLLF